MIRETIVVEGKNDAAAVRRAVDADIIITSGFGITSETIELIKKAQKARGVIVLTDPDYMGEKIRSIISKRVEGVKHAFIPREEAFEENDIGVENASPESILRALESARAEAAEHNEEFDMGDMAYYGLTGQTLSAKIRNKVGKILGIGYTNSKQFLKRLNSYGITREEFENACNEALNHLNIINHKRDDTK